MAKTSKYKKAMSGNFIFTSYLDSIEKKMEVSDIRARHKAVVYLKKKLRDKINLLYGKGDLYKGVDYKNYKRISKIGFHKPAYHAHLIELGTDERFVKNYRGQMGRQVNVGKMKKNPILKDLLMAEAGNVEDIMTREWLK